MTHVTLCCNDLLTTVGDWPWATSVNAWNTNGKLIPCWSSFNLLPLSRNKAANASRKSWRDSQHQKEGRNITILFINSFSMWKKHTWEVEILWTLFSWAPDVGCQATRTRFKDQKFFSSWEANLDGFSTRFLEFVRGSTLVRSLNVHEILRHA